MKLLTITGLFLGLMIITGGNVFAQNPANSGKFCSKDIFPRVDFTARVLNNTNSTINLYFVNYDTCEEFLDSPVFTAQPGETINVDGQNGRAYRVREAGTNKILKEISMDPKMPNITITAGAPPTNLPPRPAAAASSPYVGPDVFKNKASFKPCTPDPGWKTCLEMADPNIKIYGSRLASASALNAVVNIYTTMTHSLNAKHPRNKFDGFKVYLVNGEPWVGELINVSPINSLSSAKTGPNSGEYLRGGASGGADFLWIDEQMICKKGVATRNALGATPDNETRTLDQVVHEFAHTIMMKYIPMQTINTTFKVPNYPNYPPVERFAWVVQHWYGTPARSFSPAEDRVMNDLFSSRVSFTCDGYKP